MKHRTSFARAAILLLAALGATGCASYRQLQIEPVGKKGSIIAPKFNDSYYYFDRDHTLYFVMRSDTTDKATGKHVEQIATVRVFWRPVGGRTTMDSSALNATYRYMLITNNSVGMYEGAGFVRLWGKDGDHKMTARLMDGDLRLTEASANFVDTLGRSRLRGNFTATYNDVKATDMLLDAHQTFFARSLHIATQPAPATLPASTRPVDFPTAPTPLPGMDTPTSEPAAPVQP